MKKFLRVPYPHDDRMKGKWIECVSPYELNMWEKHHENNWLPTREANETPVED